MSEEQDREQETLDHWITNWEQQCIQEIETEPNMEEHIQNEQDLAAQKLWLFFQNTATAIAQLYKDRQQGVSLWVPFQNAASAVTSLYKECLGTQRRGTELGIQSGHQRRTRDIVAWAQKRRRNIRREELIAYLAGKTLPLRPRSTPRPRLSQDRISPRLPAHSESVINPPENDLQTFREALALQSLNGAMSNISVGYRPHNPGSPNLHSRRCCTIAELNSFICEEFSRHTEARKRTSSSTDVIMDSPTHKRSRLL